MRLVDPIRYVKLKGSGRLPSPKGLALAIVRLLQRDDYKIDDLVHLVQSDPALVGELLKFANAASFGLSRPVVSLSKAIATLGTHKVRVLVLAFSVLNSHRSGNCPQFDYEKFWSHALATAISAQELAPNAKVNAEENFTAGLLCRIGELALSSIFPESYGEIISLSEADTLGRLEFEREAFGNDHRELSATLLLEWGLPKALVSSIYHSEDPDNAGFQDGSRSHELTLSLHIALAMADVCVADDAARWAMLPNLYAKAAKLGISADDMNSMADIITVSWFKWGELLKIQTREIIPFAELLASSQPRELEHTSSVCEWPNNKSLLLICADSSESSRITHHLETNGFTVKQVSNSTVGLGMAIESKPDLIMIETRTPEINATTFCQSLRSTTHGQSAYIIIITEKEDSSFFAHALDAGADDILPRPIAAEALQKKLREAFRVIRLQKELVKERNDFVNSAGEWARANRRLTHVAMTDPLTQLSNRRHGLDTLSAEWEFAKANHQPLSCLIIDIDHFKNINDTYGHKAGDAVLVILATLLQANARNEDLVFRYGGEEFCIICPGVTLESACVVAERIRQVVEMQSFKLDDREISITVSVGVATMISTHIDKESLIHDADSALYYAKKSGRNKVSFPRRIVSGK